MSKKKEKITFPIDLTVVVRGTETTKSMKLGDEVRCLHCGKKIHIDGDSVVMVHGKYDDIPCVVCNNVLYEDFYGEKIRCGYKAFILYYIEQKEADKWKKGRKVNKRGFF